MLSGSTHYIIVLCSNLWYQDKDINYRVLINYVRDDITNEFFCDIKWKWKKWKSLAHVIKRKTQYAVKCHWLPRLIQKFAKGMFSTCWIQICHQIWSLTTPGTGTSRHWHHEIHHNQNHSMHKFHSVSYLKKFEYVWIGVREITPISPS